MNKVQKSLGGIGIAVAAVIGSVIGIEGGFSNHPDDTGGATNFGITEKVARDYGYTGSMLDLPVEVAENIYSNNYVIAPKYHRILEESQAVGHKVIDSGVNVGTVRATKWLQLSLNALNRDGKDYPSIAVDGTIGPATLSAYRSLVDVRGSVKACTLILKLLDIQQGYHYLSLGNHRSFTVGWIDNRIQNVPLSECYE